MGCGTGRNTTWLSERASQIVGSDFSEEMLARARSRVDDPRVRFVQHDVRTTWPLADASAEVVIAMLILEHVEDLAPVFAEAARVLNTGGQFFLCELHPMRQLQEDRPSSVTAEPASASLLMHFSTTFRIT